METRFLDSIVCGCRLPLMLCRPKRQEAGVGPGSKATAQPLCFRWHLFLRDSPRCPRLATSSSLCGLIPPGSSHYGSNPCLWVAPPGLRLLFQLPADGHFSWLLCWSPGQPHRGVSLPPDDPGFWTPIACSLLLSVPLVLGVTCR